MPSTTLLSLGALVLSTSMAPVGATSYQLVQNYAGQSFLDGFNFYTNSDPTHGFVQYVDQATAENNGLVSVTSSGSVYLGVDHKTTLTEADIGRQSVRVQSNYMFDQGLVVADIKHMPAGSCGVWPAFWTVGNTWPGDGEIDIIEGINFQSVNQMVLHTAGQCSISSVDQTGITTNTDCSTTAGTQGCSVTGSPGSFGTGFNNVKGGVYAMEWTSQAIKIWFWPRNTIPASILSGHPDVSQFGKPMGNFQGSCDIASVFHNQRLIFDTTFCGDWAGALFGQSGCTMKYPSNAVQSCVNYVANHPGDYQDAYWEINYVKVFEAGTSTTTTGTTVATSTTVTSSTGKSTTSFSTTLSPSSTSESSTSAATNTSPSAPPAQGSGAIGTAVPTVPVPSVTSTTAVAPYPLSNCSSTVASTKTVFVTGSPSSPSSAPAPKETVTTVVVTSYVDICPTGFTTKTTTQTVTYCPADQTTSGIAPGFTTTTKVCTACAATPTTVTLTVPVTPTATAASRVTVTTGGPATIPAGSPATVPAGSSATVPAGTLPTVPAGAAVISSPSPATSAVAATSPSAPYPTTNGISSTGAAAPTGLPASPSASGSGSGSSQPGNGSSPGSPSSSAVGPSFTGAASKLSFGPSNTLFGALISAALALSLFI